MKLFSPTLIESIIQDIRFVVRSSTRRPGFTLVIVLTLALAIGVNTAIFTMFDLFFRPLPTRSPGSLVQVELGHRAFKNEPVASFPEYVYFRDQAKTFSGLAAISMARVVLTGRDGSVEPQQLNCQYASDNFFSVLEASTILGRPFTSEDSRTSAPQSIAVLSYHLWESRFGGDRSIVGQTISLNGFSIVVIGVTSREFVGFGLEEQDGEAPGAFAPRPDPDIWMPLSMKGQVQRNSYDPLTALDDRWLTVYGRLAPGRTTEEARNEITILLNQFDSARPDLSRATLRKGFKGDPVAGRYMNAESAVRVAPLSILGEFPSNAWSVMAAVMAATGMVLLIACSNLASLLLVRGAASNKDIGLRLCLGASRGRIVRQILTGDLILGLLGGGLGLLLAWVSLRTFIVRIALSYPGLPEMSRIVFLHLTPDGRVLAYNFLLTVVATLVFGLVPALRGTDRNLATAMKQDITTFSDRGSFWLQKGLVVVQLALCLILLIGAGLLLRGFGRALELIEKPGFETNNVLVVDFDLRAPGYNGVAQQQFRENAAERLKTLPGVQAVSMAYNVPMAEFLHAEVRSDVANQTDSPSRSTTFNRVTSTYFDALSIPIIRGRGFNPDEMVSGAGIVVVSKTTAQNFWPNQEAVGQTLRSGSSVLRVIGIAQDVRNVHGEIEPYFMYLPLPRDSGGHLLVRTTGDSRVMQGAASKTVRELNSDILVKTKTLSETIGSMEELWYSRVAFALAITLGLLALLLASLGIYGHISFSVGKRTHEIGVRMALGASRTSVLRLVMGQGMYLVAIGVIIGVGGGLLISKTLSALMFGTNRFDLLSYMVASLFLVVIALLAMYVPASRATKIDPGRALRSQ